MITMSDASIINILVSVNYASRIVNYYSRDTLQIVASLTGDSWGIIYNYNVFIVQATGCQISNLHFKNALIFNSTDNLTPMAAFLQRCL